jgi:GMP synthase-like glutamine amidotransferase
MGGPMSVNDEAAFPWLVAEKRFVRDVIEAGIPVLGICLGAQVIANALGARVLPNPEKEIGWFPIQATAADGPAFTFPESTTVFHWHGETFELPPGAVRLAKSEACANQAFQIGDKVIGLQFHLETTPDSAQEIIANSRHELTPSLYVQTEQEILSAAPERYRSINRLMGEIFSYLVRLTPQTPSED